jgi:hypothetical protein
MSEDAYRLTERARIYIERHGKLDYAGYMAWVARMCAAYRNAKGMESREPIIDQADLTEFMRTHEAVGL